MSEEQPGAKQHGEMPPLPPLGTPDTPGTATSSTDSGAGYSPRSDSPAASPQDAATTQFGQPTQAPAEPAPTTQVNYGIPLAPGQQAATPHQADAPTQQFSSAPTQQFGGQSAQQFTGGQTLAATMHPEYGPQGTTDDAAAKPTKKRGLSTGGVIGIAAATALIVGAGSAVGTWALLPAGGGINTSSSGTVVQADANDTNWTAVAGELENSVVSIQVQTSQGTSQGSGVVWDGEGHVVTNNHVVEGASGDSAVTVTIGNHGYQATVVGTDPATDLAVIQVTDVPDTLVPITVGDSTALEVGDGVMAIGSPLGLSGSYTTGIVSALNRPVNTGEVSGNAVVTNAIQTSAALNPGNSGGALVDATGQLVGINSSIATLGADSSGTSGSIGIGFAIPTVLVQNVAQQLIETGEVEHAWLGTANSDGQAELDGSTVLGAEVQEVTADGPSDDAGVKKGDLIIAVNGQDISSSSSLVGTVRTLKAGDTATLTIIRDGKQTEIDVTLGVSPTLNG
ncbi:S1C family serine protease [Gulosibacter sp. ACHW.36C]|uniref:Trypsin-like peptidase domain-containing protein n=1 Tax=Gulosibacter sediminis TaxID=1729695 RepID=A0ABY4N036_9MICO|nr:trypsin-like peptidase domain-containing protein [Gulosibacter sediminis]UQN16035.1 trypsin-like peptidase domain-containing protein [Gulosibacter sediminis]